MWTQRLGSETAASITSSSGTSVVNLRRVSRRLQCQRLPAAMPSGHLDQDSKQDSMTRQQGYDVVLSSGFLAFANHSGFLQAVEEAGMRVNGVMGTSAGALAGSLYCAGYSPQEVAAHLSRDPPIALLRPSMAPWRGGVLSMESVIDRLRELLPPRFEDLNIEFAVGVVDANGEHRLIDSGPLAEAVVASAAIPAIFESVDIPGHHHVNPHKDGGVVDRVGLRAWRNRRRVQATARGNPHAEVPPALVHVISRSSPFSGFDDVEAECEPNVTIVHSPKSGVNFFSLGEFELHMHTSIQRAKPLLIQAMTSNGHGSSSSNGVLIPANAMLTQAESVSGMRNGLGVPPVPDTKSKRLARTSA